MSHQLEQNKIDGEKTIIQNPSEAQRKEHDKFEFALHEVYAVDVLISSGDGQGREKDAKITVYKKTEDTYMLKMKTSREFYSKVSKQFGTMPFNLRSMEEEKKARMGVVECVTHKLIEPFQVLFDKEGGWHIGTIEIVLQLFKHPHTVAEKMQILNRNKEKSLNIPA